MTAEVRYWCTRCASPAYGPVPALVDGYTLARCEPVERPPDPRPKSHGLVPVVTDRDLALELIAADRVRRATEQHAKHNPQHPDGRCTRCADAAAHRGHLASKRPDPTCEDCRAALERTAAVAKHSRH